MHTLYVLCDNVPRRLILKTIGLLATFLLMPLLTWAQSPRVYVDANDAFANEFSAGVVKKQAPVILTQEPTQVHYIVRFTRQTNHGSKTKGVTTALLFGVYNDGSNERVSMSVLEAKTKNLVFAYTCQKVGDRIQSVAECLAKHWNKDIQKRREKWSTLPEAADFIPEPLAVTEQAVQPRNTVYSPPMLQALPSAAVVEDRQPKSLGEIAREERAKREAARKARENKL